ncbi:MAG: LptF/LptG family permease [Spirochaetaceae bacterium]|nr:LptF/LptG family permease [Spirochaetaceae bacterium]
MIRFHFVSWTIFKYILTEAVFSFLVAFGFFFGVFFINQILLMAQTILTKKVPFQQVMLLLLYSFPTIIAMSAPFASLVGTLMTIGRLSSDNEILVMLSSGLSYRNVFVPTLVMGGVISLLSFFTNDVLLPAGTIRSNQLYRRIAVSTPALELGSNAVKSYKDTVIITGEIIDNTINDVFILDKTGDGQRRIVMAETAELTDGKDGINLDLTQAFIQTSKEIVRQDYDYGFSDFLQYRIPQDDLIQSATTVTPREMSSRDVGNTIKEKAEALDKRLDEQYNSALIQALSLEHALRNGPDNEAWNRRSSSAANFTQAVQSTAALKRDRSLQNHRIEYNKKFAQPFGAIFFVFLAVALGLFAKKSGQMVGFFFGVLISVVYWSLLFVGQTMGLRLGYSAFWTMWLPDILSLSIGLVLSIIRVLR